LKFCCDTELSEITVETVEKAPQFRIPLDDSDAVILMEVFAPTASKELITGGDNKVLYDTTNTTIPVDSWD
jgi:hypothetical protein